MYEATCSHLGSRGQRSIYRCIQEGGGGRIGTMCILDLISVLKSKVQHCLLLNISGLGGGGKCSATACVIKTTAGRTVYTMSKVESDI